MNAHTSKQVELTVQLDTVTEPATKAEFYIGDRSSPVTTLYRKPQQGWWTADRNDETGQEARRNDDGSKLRSLDEIGHKLTVILSTAERKVAFRGLTDEEWQVAHELAWERA